MKPFGIQTKSELAKLLAVAPFEIECTVHDRRSYCKIFQKKKPSGGIRTIYEAIGPLALLQQKVKEHILDKVPSLPCVHGGVQGRSVLTNARPHVRKNVVFTLDLKDFFPSVKPAIVEVVFAALGFGPDASRLLVDITTLDSQLPQGLSTSSGIANLAMTRVDFRLSALARKWGFDYTRFVDDLAISGPWRLLSFRNLIKRIVEDEDFRINPSKIRTMDAGMRQIVAGIVVNAKLNLPRENRSAIRVQTLKFVSTPKHLRRNVNQLRGKLSWFSSVNPTLGKLLTERAGNP
jgi:RNA-directed DNA polymerase